jgi:K+-sensing histidine kinase KdpD
VARSAPLPSPSTPAPPDPVDAALAELERGQRHRWLVAGLLVVAVLAALALLVVDAPAGLDRGPWAALAFLVVAVVFALSVIAEEGSTRRAIRALVSERERAAVLVARSRSLEAMHAAARAVTAVTELGDVFERLLATVRELADARTAVVLLRRGDELTVAAAEGPGAPRVGASIPVDDDPAWSAVATGETVLVGRGSAWGGRAASSVVAAPLALPDRTVGALVVERGERARAFTPLEQFTIELFAQHAALAVRNATRLDSERRAIDDVRLAAEDRIGEVAELAQELRLPVATISGYTELLQRRGDRFGGERRQAVLGDVATELDRLRSLLDELTRLVAGDEPPARDRARPPARVDAVEGGASG